MKFGAIIATVENLSESGQLGATEDALQAESTATEVAEGNAEVVKDSTEIDNIDTGIQDAFKADEQIEALIESAEDTMKEGGMSESEAKMMEVTHESIMSSIGMGHRTTKYSKNPVMSLESYASSQTRASATMVTIESLGDTAKGIVNNIVAALKAALNTVMNFIAGLLRNRALMAKHLDNLEAKVKALNTAGLKQRSATLTAGATAFSINGKAGVDTAKTILATASKLVVASSAIAEAMSSAKDYGSATTLVMMAIEDLGKNGEGSYGKLTGGRVIKAEAKDDSLALSIENGDAPAKEIAAPSRDEMMALVSQAKVVLNTLREVEKTQSKFKSAVAKVVARLSEVGSAVRSKVGTEESKAAGAVNAEAKKEARLAQTLMSKAGGMFPTAAFQAVKATADYVTAGLNNYKPENKEAAPAAKEEKK